MPPVPRPVWIEEIEAGLSDLQDLGHEVFVGLPASDAAIASFETALGVPIPASYRELVTTYGWLELSGLAIFGLERAEVQTLAARAMYELPTPSIVVHTLGVGGPLLCLDTAQPRPVGDSALVAFDVSARALSMETTTLSAWVTELVAARLRAARERMT